MPSIFDQQHNSWLKYSQQHISHGNFKIRLRMAPESYPKLLSCIGPDLVVNELMASRHGEAIIPEVCLFCTLRWLAGGSYLNICDILGISKASLYCVVWKTIRAIARAPELEIHFPKTGQEHSDAAAGFASISTCEAMRNCVGVID